MHKVDTFLFRSLAVTQIAIKSLCENSTHQFQYKLAHFITSIQLYTFTFNRNNRLSIKFSCHYQTFDAMIHQAYHIKKQVIACILLS